jgi:CobN/magnesium chelatase
VFRSRAQTTERLTGWKAVLVFGVCLLGSTAARAQDPAPRFGFLGLHGGVYEQFESVAPGLGVEVEALDEDFLSGADLDLSGFDVVFLQHLRSSDRERLQQALDRAHGVNPGQIVFSISGVIDHLLPEAVAKGRIQSDPRLAEYYRASGKENLRRLLHYVLVTRFGREGEVLPPVEPTDGALYHPDRVAPFEDVSAFRAWSREHGDSAPEAPPGRGGRAPHPPSGSTAAGGRGPG